MTLDDAKRLAASIGLAGLFGWLGKWLASREQRLAAEARAQAAVEREKIRATGETRVAEIREAEATGKHLTTYDTVHYDDASTSIIAQRDAAIVRGWIG